MRREGAWRTYARWSVVLAAAGLSTWVSRASAQEEAIPDSVATDVEGSKVESAGEATFTAPRQM